MDENIVKAKQILKDNIYCVLSTSSLDGTPWVSPVSFDYDEDFNIYWISDKNARHSKNLRDNPKVAIVIFNSQAPEGKGDGVYVEAQVIELSEKEEAIKGAKIRDKRVKMNELKVKKVEQITGNGQWRVYKAVPSKITKLSRGTFVNGQYIVKRIEVKLIN